MRVIIPGLFALALACMDVPSAQAQEPEGPPFESCGTSAVTTGFCILGAAIIVPAVTLWALGVYFEDSCNAREGWHYVAPKGDGWQWACVRE